MKSNLYGDAVTLESYVNTKAAFEIASCRRPTQTFVNWNGIFSSGSQWTTTYNAAFAHTDLPSVSFSLSGSVHRAEYSGDRYTTTDSRVLWGLDSRNGYGEYFVVKDVPETTVFGEYQANRISKALVLLHVKPLSLAPNILRSAFAPIAVIRGFRRSFRSKLRYTFKIKAGTRTHTHTHKFRVAMREDKEKIKEE